MNSLTLQCHDLGQLKTHKIYDKQSSKNPGTVRIGRDPLRCDVVLNDPTVSGLHVEVFFHPQQQRFLIRNLRSPKNRSGKGQMYAAGAITLGGPYAAVDSFLGLQYACLQSVDGLAAAHVPGVNRLNGINSFQQWWKWVLNQPLS